MPTWGELLDELTGGIWTTADGKPDIDGLRAHYLSALTSHTGRNTIIYATDWMNPIKGGNPDLSIILGDLTGLMEVFKDLPVEDGLDLILNSPGGDPTAADSLVRYMRSRFDDVRVIVPVAAMSAATMWSLSANRIVMGRHSQLGPIDPQMNLGRGFVPAAAIKRTFEKAQKECAADPALLSAWVPTLEQYFPGLLEMCDDFTRLSKELVKEYLKAHMFAADPDRALKAEQAAEFFADDAVHMAHSRGIGRDAVKKQQILVENLEDDGVFQDLVLSVHHSFAHTFSMTPAVKIIQNHLGRAWLKMAPTV